MIGTANRISYHFIFLDLIKNQTYGFNYLAANSVVSDSGIT